MINAFLTALDNRTDAPSDFTWPTFVARTVGLPEQSWRDQIIGSQLDREQHFLRCLALEGLVAGSPLASELDRLDTRRTYTPESSIQRAGLYGTTVTQSNALDGTLTPQVGQAAPRFVYATIRATSTSALSVASSRYSGTVALSFSGGLSQAFPLEASQQLQARISGAAVINGTVWTVRYRDPQDSAIQAGLAAIRTIGEPSWLPDDLLALYRTYTTDLDRLACVVAGMARA